MACSYRKHGIFTHYAASFEANHLELTTSELTVIPRLVLLYIVLFIGNYPVNTRQSARGIFML